MTVFTGPPSSAIRNKPISAELKEVLDAAAQSAGVDTVRITSGGQDALGEGTRRTGSTRHDRGRAADLQLVVGGSTLSFTDRSAPPAVLAFVTAAAAAGAIGIGAGVAYMGSQTIHVGFGTSVDDRRKLTWGVRGSSATAPQWLRDAAQTGWAAPAPALGAGGVGGVVLQPGAAPARHIVVARGGLKLRGGPGTNFASERTLALGTALFVVALDPSDPRWARVDLEGDGFIDGYVFASFLAADGGGGNEGAPEPGED
jgi:hypothetical protein